MSGAEPPGQACYDIDEALPLLGDLEDAETTYREFDLLAGAVTMWAEVMLLHRKLGWEATMLENATIRKARELGAITTVEAAKRLDVPTRDIVEADFYRRIRFIIVDGVAFIPEHALNEYRQAS